MLVAWLLTKAVNNRKNPNLTDKSPSQWYEKAANHTVALVCRQHFVTDLVERIPKCRWWGGTPALSTEKTSLSSLLLHLSFYLSAPSLSPRSAALFLPFQSFQLVHCHLREQCLFLFFGFVMADAHQFPVKNVIRVKSIVMTTFVKNRSLHRWCHRSTSITLWHQYLPRTLKHKSCLLSLTGPSLGQMFSVTIVFYCCMQRQITLLCIFVVGLQVDIVVTNQKEINCSWRLFIGVWRRPDSQSDVFNLSCVRLLNFEDKMFN